MNLPWYLQDVVKRIKNDEKVYGFELELLASHISQ